MTNVVKFRVRLTPYDIDQAVAFGKPLREYAERLAEVQIVSRKHFRRMKQMAINMELTDEKEDRFEEALEGQTDQGPVDTNSGR